MAPYAAFAFSPHACLLPQELGSRDDEAALNILWKYTGGIDILIYHDFMIYRAKEWTCGVRIWTGFVFVVRFRSV
jgi:hypothetical protein